LGRGLSALLDEAEAATTPEAKAAAGVEETPIEIIRPNPDQPRREFPEEELAGLADSIRWKGVVTPILVRPIPEHRRKGAGEARYEIVAGERRWRAAQRAGLHAIPAMIRDLSDADTLDIALIENVQRQDLNPLEEARAYKSWMERNSADTELMESRLGKSRSHILNTVRLLDMGPQVQAALVDRRITAGHARALAMAPDPESMVDQVIAQGLSVRATEALARKASTPTPAPRQKRAGRDADTVALEADLTDVLGLKVQVLDRDGVGEVRIRYATLEQLDDLCRRLTRIAG
jgi:ParB family chromosome partitioning protein